MTGIIELKNVSFAAQDFQIVKNFSYQFEEGKITALVGPSGSGKSTVLKLAAGVLIPTSGEVSYKGMNIFHMNRQENLNFRREAAMVFQDSALWANQNLDQILELPLMIHFPMMTGPERKTRISEVLKEVGYKRALNIRPSQLSMGEQKLIANARALLCRPKLLFLDEWTESLDDSASKRLVNHIYRHRQENNTAILVSHNFRFVKALSDYIIMIVGGEFSSLFSREEIEQDSDLAQRIEKGITA